MDITYLGHSSFKIKGKVNSVVTDPYDNSIGLKYSKPDADIVTISHDHSDHNAIDSVKDYKRVFTLPGEYEIGGTSFFGIASYHDDKKGEERGKNVIFVIEMDGVTVCHLGDLGHSLTEQQLEDIGTVDILMVPVGGFYTIDSKVAIEVVNAIDPKIIIPMHYGHDSLDKEKFGQLAKVEDFVNQLGVKSETLPKLTYKPGDLPEEEQRVYILEVK